MVDFILLFPNLSPSIKPLGLILVIAPKGMFTLSLTLVLTSSVKWAQDFRLMKKIGGTKSPSKAPPKRGMKPPKNEFG